MRSLVVQMAVSLDGIVDGPRSVTSDPDPEVDQWLIEPVRHAGAHLMGRVTYFGMAAYWPTDTSAFAEPMNTIPKVVFSTTLEQADWAGTQIARGDVSEEIAALKQQPGGDLFAYGGPTFVNGLIRRDLVDLYRLLVKPGAVGTGTHLFDDLPATVNLELLDVTRFPSGCLGIEYKPRAAGTADPG
jgi:dihydrofolate reductase